MIIRDATQSRFDQLLRKVRETRLVENRGLVRQVIGLVIESEGPLVAVGEVCRIESARHDGSTLAEVVGFRNNHVLLMPLGEIHGIHPGSEVISLGRPLQAPVGDALMGRVIDGLGNPLDDLGPIETTQTAPLTLLPPHPLKRQRNHARPHIRRKRTRPCLIAICGFLNRRPLVRFQPGAPCFTAV